MRDFNPDRHIQFEALVDLMRDGAWRSVDDLFNHALRAISARQAKIPLSVDNERRRMLLFFKFERWLCSQPWIMENRKPGGARAATGDGEARLRQKVAEEN